jgi:hypothetical protein
MYFMRYPLLLAGGLAPFTSAGLVPQSIDSIASVSTRDTVTKNATSINKSFAGATLFDGYVKLHL